MGTRTGLWDENDGVRWREKEMNEEEQREYNSWDHSRGEEQEAQN